MDTRTLEQTPLINPLDHPACLAAPVRLTSSGWLQHVPFGMFLVDVLRPSTLVELGTHTGVSYCGFCQAVKALGLATSCYAVDTWEGDHQAGFYGEEVYEDLKAHHDRLYGDFSRLVRTDFDTALDHFADGTITLLHIDGLHTYEAVRHDFESWLPKMSRQGVIVFHDTNVREKDFGVWRLWREVTPLYPHFEMLHGHGLGVLAVGPEQPAAMKRLLEASGGDAIVIREFFHRLGLNVEATGELRVLREAVETKEAQLQESHQKLAALAAAVATGEAQLQQSHGKLEGLAAIVETKEAQLQESHQRLAALTDAVATKEAQLQESHRKLAALAQEMESLERSVLLRAGRVWASQGFGGLLRAGARRLRS